MIGGSILLGLREAGWVAVAYDSDPVHRSALKDMGLPVIDTAEELTTPDLFVVSTPPDNIATWVCDLLERYPEAVVTDTGSVKCAVDDQVEAECSPERLRRWVPGHPLGGAPQQGFEGASPDLFAQQQWILCPKPGNGQAISVVEAMVRTLGATPRLSSCDTHDRLLAWSSHLPHLVSSALQQAASEAGGEELADFVGPGFRDATRLADMDPWLWHAIIMSNQGNIAESLTSLARQLEEVGGMIRDQEQNSLVEWLSQGALDRQKLSSRRNWQP